MIVALVIAASLGQYCSDLPLVERALCNQLAAVSQKIEEQNKSTNAKLDELRIAQQQFAVAQAVNQQVVSEIGIRLSKTENVVGEHTIRIATYKQDLLDWLIGMGVVTGGTASGLNIAVRSWLNRRERKQRRREHESDSGRRDD